ncbi:MAG TPA: alpha/beta fold hydrolase [Thermoanaerobaculia bacterium]|jgi:pimeloyl-ACP methyl ester carboxylesterase
MTNTPAIAAGRIPSPPFGVVLMRGALRVLSHTSPATASRLAADLFMTPRRFRTPDRERALLADAVPFDVRLGESSNLRAWSWGSGPLVILVHGWEGRGSQLASFVAPLVERGHRVVAFDAPGHGASDGNRSSLPHFTWGLRGVIDALGVTPHAVIAHSLGCAATTLALRDGLEVQRLVFVAPPLNPVEYTARFAEILELQQPILDRMRARIEERFLRKWSDYSLEETARELRTPLLIFHDREDQDTFYREGAALAEVWQGARLVTTEGLGHRRILRDAKVIEAATSFIAAS